ncbi:hypothetical protein AVEN_153605-1 [Araneus ventricosus]|uniref:Uncharacterized protein n=1 Tax=Araneus ventricosus TaxID=182803 RepID=A0A4Y2BQW2_ARAVE|nr:hypothetical protein AVEN_153605-1 [Araneus ventricosus]
MAFGTGWFQVRNLIPPKKRRVSGLKSNAIPLTLSKAGRGVSALVSSSPSEYGSKLRDQPQKSPRIASRRDVNMTKLNPVFS